MLRRAALAIAALALLPARARGDGPCQRPLEVRFAPAANAQIAVWLEDGAGHVVQTLFVTRSTGALGLANRPGNPLLKSDYRFPYGARAMVLPVWAHARGVTYRKVVMGGAAGFDSDDTIGNHFAVSSPEPFYCSPTGGLRQDINGVDVVSCASSFIGSKGRYADAGASVYPPRADLVDFTDNDSDDAKGFADANDVAVVSGATPPGGRELSPPLVWTAPPALADGSYTARVEVGLEGDFNASHHHASFPDTDPQLQGFGQDAIGQPSVVYAVGFVLDGTARTATTDRYQGYGDWDGASGALHPPDSSITDGAEGTGAGRLLEQRDAGGAWRLAVMTGGCDALPCLPPAPPTDLQLAPTDTSIEVSFAASAGDARPSRYEVRYRIGAPLTEDTFALGTPGDAAPPPGPPGAAQSLSLSGLKPASTVWVGVRAVAACGMASPAALASTSTLAARFTTLSGCFIATAAYGSPLARELGPLRALRDQRLLTNPLGRLAVAAYYAFSPPIARRVAADDSTRAAVRRLLRPLTQLARALSPVAASTGGQPLSTRVRLPNP